MPLASTPVNFIESIPSEVKHWLLLGPLPAMSKGEQADAIRLRYLNQYKGNTQAAYIRDLADYFRFCRGINAPNGIIAAGRSVIETYMADMDGRRGLTPSTMSRRLSTIAGYYKYAASEELIDRNPVEHVIRPEVPKDSQQLGLDTHETLRMEDAAAAHGPMANALVTLLLYDGLRISEALKADVEHLSEIQGYRTLKIVGKGGGKRAVRLNALTVHALNLWRDGRQSGPLFTAADGERLRRIPALRLIRRIARNAELANWPQIGPHSLRHTFVTLALKAGVALEEVQDAAGHADPRTTQRYNRARYSLEKHPAERLADYLARERAKGATS
jgi:site-specific recombinase XerD